MVMQYFLPFLKIPITFFLMPKKLMMSPNMRKCLTVLNLLIGFRQRREKNNFAQRKL